jgi:hypothetical protein
MLRTDSAKPSPTPIHLVRSHACPGAFEPHGALGTRSVSARNATRAVRAHSA